jgi:uncharacterized membrane protein YsdA (DUF1294 family)
MSTLAGTIISFDPSRSVGLIQLAGSIDVIPFQECDILNRSAFHARLVGRTVKFELVHNGSSYQAVRIGIIPWWLSAPRDWLAIALMPALIWTFLTFGAEQVGWPPLTSYLAVVNFLTFLLVHYLSRQWNDRRMRPAHYALFILALAGGAIGAFFGLLFDWRKHFSAKARIFFIMLAVLQIGWLTLEHNPALKGKLSLPAIRNRGFLEAVRIK